MVTEEKQSKTVPKGLRPYPKGVSGNLAGRPKETEEKKLVKKEVKKFLKRYEENILQELPELSPKLISQAKKGNMQAFDQIHKIVGAYKNVGGNTIIPIQINFKDNDL